MNALLNKASEPGNILSTSRQSSSVEPLVLVVEDHEDTRFMLEYLLGARGYRVSLTDDGEEAVRLAEREPPDLILMDTGLRRIDGLSATRRMREMAALREVPIVFLSGHAQPAARAAALETGGNEYVVKPFELSELERVLDRYLGKSNGQRRPGR